MRLHYEWNWNREFFAWSYVAFWVLANQRLNFFWLWKGQTIEINTFHLYSCRAKILPKRVFSLSFRPVFPSWEWAQLLWLEQQKLLHFHFSQRTLFPLLCWWLIHVFRHRRHLFMKPTRVKWPFLLYYQVCHNPSILYSTNVKWRSLNM